MSGSPALAGGSARWGGPTGMPRTGQGSVDNTPRKADKWPAPCLTQEGKALMPMPGRQARWAG